jgi:glutathione S-transferase
MHPPAHTCYLEVDQTPYGVLNSPMVSQRALSSFGIHLRMCGRIRGHKFTGIEFLDESSRLKAWLGRIKARPAVPAGFAIPKVK